MKQEGPAQGEWPKSFSDSSGKARELLSRGFPKGQRTGVHLKAWLLEAQMKNEAKYIDVEEGNGKTVRISIED
jgi:hypothetical protein